MKKSKSQSESEKKLCFLQMKWEKWKIPGKIMINKQQRKEKDQSELTNLWCVAGKGAYWWKSANFRGVLFFFIINKYYAFLYNFYEISNL